MARYVFSVKDVRVRSLERCIIGGIGSLREIGPVDLAYDKDLIVPLQLE